jgi:ubiquinone biosynthesis protein
MRLPRLTSVARAAAHSVRNTSGGITKGARSVPGRERRMWEVTAVISRQAAGAGGQLVGRWLRGRTGPEPGPAHLRAALEELGPTFVKLGQLLSTRPDLVTERYQTELGKLRDHVQPIPRSAVGDQIEQSLGRPVSELYGRFDWTPLASASVGQVHAATLTDGRAAVVKVLRPGLCPRIDADLDLLDWFARGLVSIGVLRRYDPVGLVRQFGDMLRCEVDYTIEAANARFIGRAVAGWADVVTPAIIDSLSNASVLTMDRIDGVSLSDRAALDAAGVDRSKLAATVARTYMSMSLTQDRFHADPHPGNLFAMSGDRLGIVDFGEVGTIGPDTRLAISTMIVSIATRDSASLADSLLKVCVPTKPVSRAELGSDLRLLLDQTSGALGSVRLGPTLRRLMATLRRHGLLLPADLALLLKTIIECESTAAELDPDFDPSTMLSDFGRVATPGV